MTSVPPPTEFFPGINFNPSFYNLGQSAVTLDYLNSNFLRSTGYAISRAQYTLFNGSVNIQQNLDVSQNINASAYLLNGVPFTPSQWTTSGNDIYYNTGNVGIGKTNPTYELDVSGNINVNSGSNYKINNVNIEEYIREYFATEDVNFERINIPRLIIHTKNISPFLDLAKLDETTGEIINQGLIYISAANNNRYCFDVNTTDMTIHFRIFGSNKIVISDSANIFYNPITFFNNNNLIFNGSYNELSDKPTLYTDTNVRTVLSTSAGTNMTWNTGTNKFDVSVPPSYTDTNTRTVLSTSAGTNMTWNTGTNKFDVAVTSYTLPIASNGTLGGVKSGNDISVNPTTGIMSLSGNDIYLHGTTNKEYSWSGSNSSLGRAATAQAYSTSSIINDLVLRSAGNLILQSGTAASALIINTTNQAIFRNAVGVGLTTISAGTIFDVGGIFKIATGSGTERLTITSTGVQVNNTLNVSSGLNTGGLIRFGGFADDSSFDLAIIQNREYATNKGELLLFRGDNIADTTGVDRIRLRSGAIAFDTYPATSTSSTAENIRMYIDGNGNVGIGNTAPTAPLCVGNSNLSGSNGFITIGKNNGGGGARSQYIGYNSNFDLVIGDYSGGSGPLVEAFKLSYAAPANSLVIDGGGGISTVGATSLGSSLSVAGTSFLRNTYIYSGNEGTSIALYFGTPFTGSPNGASKSAIIAQAISSYSRHNLSFCLNMAADNNANVTTNDAFISLTWDGWIQANRPFRFATNVWNVCIAGFRRVYYSPAGEGVTYYSGGNSGGFAARTHEWRRTYDDATLGFIENTGLLRTYGYSSLSDSRIKKNIRDIDDAQGLEKILLIQPKKYNYIEKERNKHDVIGFIAQQIGEVIPEAITKTEGIPPNIYKNCLVNNKREIYYSLPLDVVIDIDVIITDTEDGTGERYKIKEIYDDYFVIDKDIDRDEVFVKGYSINDLHNLDKNYIYTLNVCATQELYKLIMEQREEINNLKNRLSTLENVNNCQ